ncbi:chromate efflux transporter [uncultured Roseobacter sp.]|uniref:chromate efflux transporter n=1 Tax=uncultured Roseobacter sp. TaxID=114847 RepID=UPI00260E261A|nr:chromate efflux transporter [uncultured Roseobacter sp.]
MTPPSDRELIRVFGRIGLLSFGGPAAQIALMHRELVEERAWLSDDAFLRALSLCMLLPGPEAMQLATYAGWRLRGTSGGLIAGLLFVVPGAVVILVLALGYALYGQMPLVQAAFSGIKAAVIIIVLQALLKVARKSLLSPASWALACFAFLALFLAGLPFPLVVLAAAAWGAFTARATDPPLAPVHPESPRTLRTLLIWGGLWAGPVVLLLMSDQPFLTDIALFFSKLAVITFGGAYAVLAWITQTVVNDFGWITTGQMIDALGLAETTPGPLILVTEFVALLAGYAQGGPGMALAAGAITLWVTFVPCFLWIFLAGPYLDVLSARPVIAAALQAITAAVVGVILNLALWFAIHVLFDRTQTGVFLAVPVPDFTSLNGPALVLTAVAAVVLLGLRWNMIGTLGFMALAGLAAQVV